MYQPNLVNFVTNRAERLSREASEPEPPEFRWPKVHSSLALVAAVEEAQTVTLSASHLQEIHHACLAYHDSGARLDAICKETFPLPLLQERLAEKRLELHKGCGLVVVRGIDPSRYSHRENIIIFAGLSSYLSERRGRQTKTEYLVHLKDLTRNKSKVYSSPYCNDALPFHTDYGDVVAMFVLKAASKGGAGIFAPVLSVYNILVSTCPDLLPILCRPDWPFYDRPPNNNVYHERPIMYMDGSGPEMIFSRGSLMDSPRSKRPPGIKALTDIQAEALDAVHFAATDAGFKLNYETGDMIYFNNRKILHGRENFDDREDISEGRHILRLWLQDYEMAGPPLKPLSAYWERIFNTVDEAKEELRWPLEPRH
ncbi:Clavaminate synthase-like protein [Glonium stellatum]|uniref:Clavaminate synthase-like protein n=1 Tax=Glonium stellatum TaxID=574774 RepID=A0A8E2JR04_9PEZI|nr:Clavaminate synthase-like protein [Glonium stellatum]